MLSFTERIYIKPVPRSFTGILAADIGGTNSNFGIFRSTNGELVLVLSLHFKSQQIKNFTDVVEEVLAYLQTTYGISIEKAGFAAAGVVSERRDWVKPTNLSIIIDAKDILKKTGLSCVFVVNDFEIIGYGLNRIKQQELVKINNGKPRTHANKAILGAGTGLGKCILIWHKELGRYIPSASEGGHADFAPQTQDELDLVLFIKKTEKRRCNISWEDVLSGYGIQHIYRFFCYQNNMPCHSNGPHPDEIFKNRDEDENCHKTFKWYTLFYARCAKDFTLDALALSGVYIAGGIAAKNLPLFLDSSFMKEFINCGKQQELLQQVPIYVITNYNISMHGAAAYMLLENMC
jgi:glucokinase